MCTMGANQARCMLYTNTFPESKSDWTLSIWVNMLSELVKRRDGRSGQEREDRSFGAKPKKVGASAIRGVNKRIGSPPLLRQLGLIVFVFGEENLSFSNSM